MALDKQEITNLTAQVHMLCKILEPHLLSLRQAQKVYSVSDQMATVRPNSLYFETGHSGTSPNRRMCRTAIIH